MPAGEVTGSLAEFATRERQGRIEPELGPPTVSLTAYPNITSDSSAAAAGLSDMVSNIHTEPRPFDPVTREKRPTLASSRSGLAERPRVSSFFHLFAVGLTGAAIVGVFFGIAFSLLPQRKDKTALAGGSALPAAEQSVSTAKGSAGSGNPPATIGLLPARHAGPAPARAGAGTDATQCVGKVYRRADDRRASTDHGWP